MIRTIIFSLLALVNMQENSQIINPSRSLQDEKPLFSFGIITDVQYCKCEPAGTRYYSNSLSKLREAVNVFRSDSLYFIMDLGDLIDRDYASYEPVMNILDSSGIKVFHVTGNHDFAVDSRYKKRIPQLRDAKEGYYSFSFEKFRFIALNGNEISTYGTGNKKIVKDAEAIIQKIKDTGGINSFDWNGAVGDGQLSWLISQLEKAKAENEKVIIFCHFPVWPENQHNLLNYGAVLSVLEKYDHIIAWFNGHNHSGNYGNFNMIHFVTLRGMVETEDNNSFSIIDIYKNKIWINGAGREKSQILAY